MKPKKIKRLVRRISWYPPYIGAGIRFKSADNDLKRIEIRMKLRWFNKNLFGTHFGGSLYSMTDPFFAVMLSYHLGEDYIIWDKSAKIQFKKPGRGAVTAVFELSDISLNNIKSHLQNKDKITFTLSCEIRNDKTGELVASVDKELYVRRKKIMILDVKPPFYSKAL